MAEDKQNLGPHQFAAKVNLISDWVVEHKPQLVKHNRYIRRCLHQFLFLYQEDSKFDLGGDIVQVWDDVSPRNTFQLDYLDGARFLSLSDYSVVDLISSKFSGVAMELRNKKKVTMLFSKFSNRRYQQINRLHGTICCLHQCERQNMLMN
jgi:hypothetical protein